MSSFLPGQNSQNRGQVKTMVEFFERLASASFPPTSEKDKAYLSLPVIQELNARIGDKLELSNKVESKAELAFQEAIKSIEKEIEQPENEQEEKHNNRI
jgi:hypothetical protein